MREAQSPGDVFRLLQQWKVGYFIARKPAAGEKLRPPALEKVLAVCGAPEQESGDLYLAHLEPDCNERVSSMRVPDRPSLTVTPGFYDDLDPAILFPRIRSHDETFKEPMRQTVSYTDLPGAEIIDLLRRQGPGLRVHQSSEPRHRYGDNRQGADSGKIDLYSAKVEWQQSKKFAVSAGKHLAVIKVTGEHQPSASGKFVDLDAFVIE